MSAITEFNQKAKAFISEQVKELSGKLTAEQASDAVEMPSKGAHHFQLTIGRINKYYKLGRKPQDVAEEWQAKFKTNDDVVKCEVGRGHLAFYINTTKFATAVVKDVMSKKEKYGHSKKGEGKTVLVEFSSPNIAKVFHAGHLRSTILGNFLQNVYRATGHTVVGINYLGDWGKQYGLLAVGFSRFGDREKLKANPIRHLYDIYVKANRVAKEEGDTMDEDARAYFAKMEAGDESALALWKEFRDLSIEEYKLMYKRLNVSFDLFSGESQVSEGMEDAFALMKEKDMLTLSNGATLVDLESHKKGLGKCLVKKTDGSSLYITRDVAAAKKRWDGHKFDKMLYVVGTAQSLHFSQLFKVLELMGYDWAKKCQHINFGLVNGMSSRSGTAVFLEDILEEAKAAMLETMKDNETKYKDVEDPELVADLVGMSAVIIQDLSAKRHKDYDFNWERMTRFEGQTGPYLMYSHARLFSILRKAGTEINPDADMSLVTEPQAAHLAAEIAKFEDVVERACQNAEPVTLVSYLFSLSQAINSAVTVLKVKGSEKNLAEARLILFESARITLNNGMVLLGLTPVERM